MESGELAVPEDPEQAPVFEEGRTYRLFVTPDFINPSYANCTFTFGSSEPVEEEGEQTCESDNTLCTTVQIPESLTETPEKLVLALYKSLPPLGPPDVFPPFSIDAPELTPGEPLEIMMDANASGTYQVYVVAYMPGGGLASWQALAGVDYVGRSEAIELSGKGLTIEEPISLEILE